MIYYTGYAKFFDEDYSEECDDVSWSTWIYVCRFSCQTFPIRPGCQVR